MMRASSTTMASRRMRFASWHSLMAMPLSMLQMSGRLQTQEATLSVRASLRTSSPAPMRSSSTKPRPDLLLKVLPVTTLLPVVFK